MALSDCPKCWNTPCTCGYEYKEWSAERKQEFAATVLGMPMDALKDLLRVKAELELVRTERDTALVAAESSAAKLVETEVERDEYRLTLLQTTGWMEKLRESGDAGFWDWNEDDIYGKAIALLEGEAS